MGNLWQDVQFGFRMLRKNRGVTAVAILALALGIGANTAIFSVVHTVLIRPLPHPDPDRLVWFWESQPDLPHAPFSAADFADYQTQNRSFDQMAAVRQNMRSMDRVAAETVASRRLTLWLVGAFAVLALLLAAVGIYGVMSYSVTERMHEIGVRMALGAQWGDVVRLVVGRAMRLAGAGLIVGTALAFLATRGMTSLLFEVRPGDPLTYLGIAALLVVVALAACYLPARRAIAVSPVVALRYE